MLLTIYFVFEFVWKQNTSYICIAILSIMILASMGFKI